MCNNEHTKEIYNQYPNHNIAYNITNCHFDCPFSFLHLPLFLRGGEKLKVHNKHIMSYATGFGYDTL